MLPLWFILWALSVIRNFTNTPFRKLVLFPISGVGLLGRDTTNIKIGLKEIERKVVHWIQLAWDCIQYLILVNAVMNLAS
jgi:hypothetical protein